MRYTEHNGWSSTDVAGDDDNNGHATAAADSPHTHTHTHTILLCGTLP